MDQSTFMLFVAIATMVGAIALVLQACFLFGTYKATQALRDRVMTVIPKVEALIPKVDALIPKVEALLPKVEGLLESSRMTVEESRGMIADLRQKSNLLLDSGHRQIKALETLVGDASERTHRQMEHAEVIIGDTLERAEETVALVHRGIMKPIRGITGLAAGLSAALQMLMRGGRPNPDTVTMDEEMFI